jgi:hypothetical protein
MSCKIDKLETIDDNMGGLVVDVEELSTELIERLKSPNLSIDDDNTEWLKIFHEVLMISDKQKNLEGLYVLNSKKDILFRTNENLLRNPDFVTRYDHDSQIGIEKSRHIYSIIDYSIIKESFASREDAQKKVDSWKNYVNRIFQNFCKTTEPPELYIHIRDSEDKDPISFYHDNHPSEVDISCRDANQAPAILIDCGFFEKQRNYNKNLNYSDSIPDFQLFYSLSNEGKEIQNNEIVSFIDEITNGFIIIDHSKKGINKLINILDLSSTLAIKYMLSGEKESYLLDDFWKSSFKTSKNFLSSKSSSIVGKEILEKGLMPPSILKYFHHDWAPFQGVDFYNQIQNYDYFLRQLPDAQLTELRINLEQKKNRFQSFIIDLMNISSRGKRDDFFSKLFSYRESMRENQLHEIEAHIDNEEFIDLGILFNIDKNVELVPTKEAVSIICIIHSIIFDQSSLYQKSCALVHSLKNDDCEFLNEQGFDFNLIHHLDMYWDLFKFLKLYSVEIKLASPLIQTQICKFFQLKPSNWGEEE